MNYRAFGSTDIKVSEIGFGCWGIGGNTKNAIAYGPTNDEDSIEALNTSFERGVNFFDTSPLYGFGHSEELLGKVFSNKREQVIYATKVGYTDFSGKQNFSPDYIEKSLNDSLRRLKTDYVDIIQMHDLPLHELETNFNIVEKLDFLKKQGKCRYFGISNKTQNEAEKTINQNIFQSIQLNFNLVDQRALKNKLFEFCDKKNTAIICKTPLCFGFLTGQYNLKTLFHRDDHRSKWSEQQIELWSNSLKIFLKELKNSENQSLAQFSLRFCLSFKEISTVIPGMLNKKQVIENTQTSKYIPFSNNVLYEINKIYDNNNFFIK